MKRRMTTLLLGAILCCTSFAQSEVEEMLQNMDSKVDIPQKQAIKVE